MISNHYKDLLIVFSGRVVNAILMLIALRIFTKILSPDEYGLFGVFFLIQTFCGLIIVNPVGQYINLNTHNWLENNILLSGIRFFIFYLIFASILSSVIGVFYFNDEFNGLSVFFLIFAFLFSVNLNSTLIPMLNLLQYRKQAIYLNLLSNFSGLLLGVVIYYYHDMVFSLILGQIIGMILGTVWAYKLIREISGEVEVKKMIFIKKDAIYNYCIPIAIATGLMWLQQNGYKILVKDFYGMEIFGFIFIASQLALQVFGICENIITQFINPYFFKRLSECVGEVKQSLVYSDYVNLLIPIYSIILAFAIVSTEIIAEYAVDRKYSGIVDFLIFVFFVEFFRIISNTFGMAINIKKNAFNLTFPYAIGVFICLGGSFFVILFDMDVFYVLYALVFSSLISSIVMIISMIKKTSVEINVKNIVFSFFFFSFCVAFFFGFKSIGMIYTSYAIGYAICIFWTVWFFLNLKKHSRLINGGY